MKGQEFNWGGLIMIILGVMVIVGVIVNYGFLGEKIYMDYVYSTATNDTLSNLAVGTNATHNKTLTLGALISGEADGTYLTVNVNNTNTTNNATVTVYLNSNSLGSYTALNGTVTPYNFTELQDYLISGENTVLYVSDLATPTQTVTETSIYYNSDTKDVGNKPLMDVLALVMVLGIIISIIGTIINAILDR